ncbi:MAG: hypothetical protein AAF390_06415 [Pseudomonadota bacterium]
MPDTTSTAPLWSVRGMVVLAVLAAIGLWPMLAGQAMYIFADTASYVRGGAKIWDVALGFLPDLSQAAAPAPESGAATGGGTSLTVNQGGQATVGRSFLYSFFTFVLVSLGNAPLLQFVQGFLVLIVVAAFVTPESLARRGILVAGTAYLILVTSFPWYLSFIMPDILAAVPILFGALLIRRFDELPRGYQVILVAITAFAAAAHYGNGPLMFGVIALALGWRLLTGRLRMAPVIAGVVVVLFAPLANVTASTAVLKSPSMAPQRLPILLARSLEDGPARWYLEEACPEADLVFCDVFEEVPSNVGMFLWTKKGIDDITPAQMRGIRDEEFEILRRAFFAYPVQQTTSLARNAAKQTIMVGMSSLKAADFFDEDRRITRQPDDSLGFQVRDTFDPIVVAATWIGVLPLLLLLLTGRLTRPQVEILAMTILGLLVNAAIFGGLSAPVERYQSRVIWILPFLSTLFLAQAAVQRARLASPA